MPYITVTDPETGEQRTEWRDKASITPEETGKGFTALDANKDDNLLTAGAKAIPRMFINAGINAVQEGSDTIRDIGGAVGIGEGTTRAEPDKAILGLGDWKPETLESSGVIEDIGTGILQFGLEWVLLSKALKGVSYGVRGSKALANIGTKAKKIEAGAIALAGKSPVAPKAAQSLTKFGSKVLTETSPKAAVIDFAGFDQYEGRLYDLVKEADKWDVVEKIPLLNVLETNPDDEGLKGRAKNALEGFFIDLGIGGAITGRSALKIIKAKKLAKKLADTPKGSAEYKELLPKVIKQGEELASIPEIRKKLSEESKLARTDRAAFDKSLAHLPPAERDRLWQIQRTNRGLVVDKRGVKTVTGDLDSVRKQIEELGPEPPKPGKGKSIVNGKHTPEYKTWNKWNRTNKALRARLDELEPGVEIPGEIAPPFSDAKEPRVDDTGWVDADGKPVSPEDVKLIEDAQRQAELDPDSQYNQDLREEELGVSGFDKDAATQEAKEMADAIESGDVPYWWGPGDGAWKPKDVEFWGGDRKRKVDENVAAMVMEGRTVSEIIENLKGNRPQRIPGEETFPSIADAKGISLANYRGVDKIKAKLRSLVGQDFKFTNKLTGEESIHRYTRDDYEPVYEFIELMGEELFDDVVLSLKQISAEGRFNFARKLIEINRKTIATGDFSDTMVHELWHSLSRYLPAKDLKRYAKEWKVAKEKYIKDMKKKLLIDPKGKNGKVLSAKQVNKLREGLVLRGKELVEEMRLKMKKELGAEPAREDVLEAFAKTAESKKMQKTFDEFETHRVAQAELDGFRTGKYTDQNYRYVSMDEYFAEMLKDQFFLHINKKALAPEGSFRRLLQDVGIFFKEIWVQIHAALGGPNTEKIFNDYLKGRNNKKLRKYALESYFDPDWVKGVEATAMVDALDVLIAGGRSEVVERSAFDDVLFGDGISVDKKRGGIPEDPWDSSPGFDREGLDDDVLNTYRKILDGDERLLDAAGMWNIEQDVTRMRSPSGRQYYSDASEPGSDFEVILNAISKRWDRIQATGMPALSGRKIAQELESVFREQGIDLKQILFDEKLTGATEIFQNNVENATNLIKLKFGLNFASEEAAYWATQSMNAVHNPSIDRMAAVNEMHRYLDTALQFSRVYQIWTRSAGQLLQTAQTQINTQGITETLKRQSLSFDRASAIAEASKVPPEVVYTNLPPEYIRALDTGEWTPKAESFRHQIETLVADTDKEHGLKTIQDLLGAPEAKEGVKRARNITDWEKRGKGLAVYYVNNLLSAAKTWAVQGSGLARTVAEPAFMGATNLNPKMMLQQYNYMIRTFYGSLKLGQKAWMTGQSLYDPKIRTGAWAGDMTGQIDMNNTYARNRAYQLDDPHPSYDLNNTPFINELKNNPAHHTANVLWRLGTWNIRGQLALDTFTKSLAGNSLAYVVGLDEGMIQGAAKGLQGIELDNYAKQWADAKVEFYTFDAVINGETIANAIMKDETALQIGRILTFTDDVRAKMPNRTKRYGMELARARGMVDENEIEKFAKAYRNGELEGAQKLWNRFTRSADGAIQDADNLQNLPGVGELTPTLTSAWSQVPQFWGKMQSAKHGYLASFIQPFNRSPGDITKQWVRMIPGLNMTVDTFYRDLFNENVYLRNRWKSEVAIGTTTGGLFAATVLNNDEFPIEFTGYGPNNPSMRKEWTDGERPALSWRTRGRDRDGNPVYGKWHSYRAFEPAATFIGGLADYKMLYADMSEKERKDLIAGFSMSTAAQVMLGRFNSTYYKGIVEFIDAVADVMPITNGGFMKRELEPSERNKLSRYMQRFVTNFIPESGRLRETSRAMDRYKRTIDSSVAPIQSFDEADEGLVKTRDALGRIIYLKEADAEFQDGNPLMTWVAGYWRQQIDEIKNTIPGFSEDLPERINWVTGLPIRNAGFLGSNQLPYDDAPWLSRLTGAYFGTLLGTPSEFGIGAKGHDFDPRTPNQKKKGVITKNYKAALVNDELIKLSRAGATFPPPRPSDFGQGIRLSAPAFRQYKEYIYSVKLGKYGNVTLMEALYNKMRSKNEYQKFKYIIHPIKDSDARTGFAKNEIIQEIMNDFKHKAKEKFREDPTNEYRMEVVLTERQIRAAEELQEEQRRGGRLDPIYEQSDSMGTSTQEFTAQLNQ